MSHPPSGFISLFMHLFLLHGAQCQGPVAAPSPALDCTNALLNLSACSTYVEAGSNLTRPKKGCCHGLAGVVDVEPVCLCQLIDNYGGFGIRIDTTKALMLPTACRIDPPPANLCAVLGSPIASLTPSSGGPEEPGSITFWTPVAAPPNSNNGSSSFRDTGLAFLILALVLAIF